MGIIILLLVIIASCLLFGKESTKSTIQGILVAILFFIILGTIMAGCDAIFGAK